MNMKAPGKESARAEGQPRRRRRRSGLRPALRAKLVGESDVEPNLADRFRRGLLEVMDRRGIAEVDLAQECGCTLENIRQILGGGRSLRFDTAEKLCRALGLRVALSLEETR